MTNRELLRQFEQIHASMMAGGGDERIEAQRRKGKRIARERIVMLTDRDSFIEHQCYVRGRSGEFGLDKKRYFGDGVVTGAAIVNGRQICLCSQDFTVLGGSLGEMQAIRIAEVQEMALRNGCPFIQINDSGGARIQEGVLSLHGYARIFRNNTRSSGVVPQISIILGPCAGGAVYSPAITDFIIMVDGISNMYITGPDVIAAVTGERIEHADLGGAVAHSSRSGVAHFRCADEEECMGFVRRFLGYLPSNNREHPPIVDSGDPIDRRTPSLLDLLPDEERKPYDIRSCITEIFDRESFIEIHRDWAENIVIGLARLAGGTVGIIANQPKVFAAALDIDASDKAARFLRFCDAFNIPIVSLVDVPGFLPGVAQEHGGIIRHGAKMLYAIAEATVPKVALILRKAYGGAFISMASKALGYDRVLAFPTAQIAVMGAEGAASIIFRQEIRQADDPETTRQEKIEDFRQSFMNPFVAAGLGYIDDIIDPAFARIELIRSIGMNATKQESPPRRKHGNIPL